MIDLNKLLIIWEIMVKVKYYLAVNPLRLNAITFGQM